MKVAVCLHGQPRNYNAGYENISNFIILNNSHKFDFFIHCWCGDKVHLETSPRENEKKYLYIEDGEQLKNDLIKLYKPSLYEFEEPKKEFDFNEMLKYFQYNSNFKNIYSQMYSRNKVRQLLYDYSIKKNTEYDMVVSVRIDFRKKIDLKLDDVIENKTYISNIHLPRRLMPDNFILCPFKVYLNWFDFFENIPKIAENENLKKYIGELGESICFNMEQIIFSNYLLHYNINDVICTDKIPNFI